MRLVTFGVHTPSGAAVRSGVALEGKIIDLELAAEARRIARGGPRPADLSSMPENSHLLTLLKGGEQALQAAREGAAHVLEKGDNRLNGRRVVFAPHEVQLLAPLPRPNSLRDYMVIEEHVRSAVTSGAWKEIPAEWYRTPAHYKGNVDEIYGPDDTVPWPAYTEKLDYELEICAVIGTAGRRVSAEDAARHILGYTLYNDWSARDMQAKEMSLGIGPGISKDFASSLGPCIVTADEFDRNNARLEARVDGEVWSTGTIGTMHFSFEQLIEWTSQEQTLLPGDLLGSGTVGKGCGFELGRWVSPGCVVELEAEGIGVLRNQIGEKGQGPKRAFDLTALDQPRPATPTPFQEAEQR